MSAHCCHHRAPSGPDPRHQRVLRIVLAIPASLQVIRQVRAELRAQPASATGASRNVDRVTSEEHAASGAS